MSHWAEIDENNKVIRVTVGDNNSPDEGYQWLIDNLGGRWIQTSYNNSIRKQYAGLGYTYNEENDVFVAPQPFPSWTLNETFDWEPPTPRPEEGIWVWNEDDLAWAKIEAPTIQEPL